MEDSMSGSQNQKVVQLQISRLFPGMVTARDVYNRNNQLIIHKGAILDSDTIMKLIFYAIESIFVYECEILETETEIYVDRLKESMEFRQFSKKYDAAVMSLQDYMKQMVETDETAAHDRLLHNVNDILYSSRDKMHLLSMLYCVRNQEDSTYMHCVNVALVSNVFGQWLNLSREDREVLTLCGMLHDIGKILVPKRVLNKPERLTSEEYEVMKQHTSLGYRILKNKNIDDRIKRTALLHHERYDGSGYSTKQKDEIDKFTMIVSIADVYDAMISNRVYRGAVCPFDVIGLFEEDELKRYDPAILIPLLQNVAESYIGHWVRLSNGQQGEIIMLNRYALSKPMVKISEHEILDLSKRTDITIEEVR